MAGYRVTTDGLQTPSQQAATLPDIQWAIAAGTADALTAAFATAITELTDGLIVGVRALLANATATPTFSPDSLTAHTITRQGGTPLKAGDIPATLAEVLLRYNLAFTRWELLNPARGISGLDFVAAGGSADAITATFAPAVLSLTDGLTLRVRAASANATTTPTFAPNGLTAHTITKFGGTALAVGDIAAANHELILTYNLANTRWELLNPYPGAIAAGLIAAANLARDEIIKVLTANVAATSGSSAQPWFPSGGTVTLVAGTYRFQGLLLLGTGTTTHTTAMGFGGTAVLTSVDYMATTTSVAATTIATAFSKLRVLAATSTVLCATSTAVETIVEVDGIIIVGTGGTLIPQFTFSANPTGTNNVLRGSFFLLKPLVTNPAGTWA